MTRLVQLQHTDGKRCVGIVGGSTLKTLTRFSSIYDLVNAALNESCHLPAFVLCQQIEEEIDYDEVYVGKSRWRLLPSIDHPHEPSRCLITGTGLTHTASAEKRRTMHGDAAQENDSIRMYRWGVTGGRPAPGTVGISPEWFYKGTGAILRAHGEPLCVPPFAEDAGEEAEVAGVYLIDAESQPRRIGMSVGNEFADHQFEKRNYLYLAASKLRQCALGPELVLDSPFNDVSGQVKIERAGAVVWSTKIATGQANMSHSLANIEHHHFKFAEHRRPGDVHIHFYGADAFSFGEGVALAEGDTVEIAFSDFGRPLRNSVQFEPGSRGLTVVTPA